MFVNLVRNDDREIAFRRSKAVRYAILFILAAVDVYFYVYFSEQISMTHVGDGEYVWCVPMLIIVIINFLVMRYAGPDDLVLDIDRQTYTHTTGYPFFARSVTGTFGDFYGLCVRPIKNRRKAVIAHRVELDWNTPGHKPLVLAETGTLQEARTEQHLLARRLGSIPIEKD
jgi:hypothetical protein